MIAAVALLYAAEVALTGGPRWAVFALGIALLAKDLGCRERVRPSRAACAVLVVWAAWVAVSPGLALVAVLLLVPRTHAERVGGLTLLALALHLLWWRYLSAFQLLRLPSGIATALSSLAPSDLSLTASALVVSGQSVAFSNVPVLLIWIPSIATALTRRFSWPWLRLVSGASISFVAALWMAATLALVGHTHFFATPWWPLACVVIGTGTARVVFRDAAEARPNPLAWHRTLALVVALPLVCNAGFRRAEAPLRIAFDETHGKWESVEEPFDTVEYGRHTVYNYTLLARWLGTTHEVSALDAPWTSIDADVLVVTMPTAFFTDAEKAAIHTFVSGGGLLVAIGDHTNLYGASFVLNDLLGPYGLELEFDATAPWDEPHYALVPSWWQRSRYLAGVPVLSFQTAATIRASHPLVLPILVADRVSGEDADYSNERFFGALHPSVDDRQPPLVLGAERRYGRGRVILFADSTIFSTFSLMAPGNSELFQNFIEEGVFGRSRVRVALLVVVLVLFTGWSAPIRGALALLAATPMAFVLSSTIGASPPRPYPASWIDVDGAHSRLDLRADPRGEHGPGFEDYSTFYAWIARTGATPRVQPRSYQSPDVPTILLNPDKAFTATDLDDIERYVRLGGRLLILDDPHFASRSSASSVLNKFGIGMDLLPGRTGIHNAGPPRIPSNVFALPFEMLRSDRLTAGAERARGLGAVLVPSGLTPTFTDAAGTVIAGQKQVGKGSLAVFLRSAVFSEVGMGDVWGSRDLDPELRRLYQLEFDLIGQLRGTPR